MKSENSTTKPVAKELSEFFTTLLPEEQHKVLQLSEGIQHGNRALLARAITLVESSNANHRKQAMALMDLLLPVHKLKSAKVLRLGISGVPGVGKSTFLENFGLFLCDKNLKVAVLAVDPSSPSTGGSILGDKTRMQNLSVHENAFIRPSPAGKTLGGVADKTREAQFLCEAFGFDVVCIETVGVGQSEVEVSRLVDVFCVLMLANAGDELQGIKKGILELANFVLINKCDAENAAVVNRAVSDYSAALKVVHGNSLRSENSVSAEFFPRVMRLSGQTGTGIPELWVALLEFQKVRVASGNWWRNREAQMESWLKHSVEQAVLSHFWATPGVVKEFREQQELLIASRASGTGAAERILSILYGKKDSLVAEPKKIDKHKMS